MSVMVVLAAKSAQNQPGEAGAALTVAVIALAAAGFFADLEAHTAAYGAAPTGWYLWHLVAITVRCSVRARFRWALSTWLGAPRKVYGALGLVLVVPARHGL